MSISTDQYRKEFRKRLRKAIRKSGGWIANHADDIVPEIDYIGGLTIHVYFPEGDMLMPTIDVDYEYICPEVHKALYGLEEEDGHKRDMEKENKGSM